LINSALREPWRRNSSARLSRTSKLTEEDLDVAGRAVERVALGHGLRRTFGTEPPGVAVDPYRILGTFRGTEAYRGIKIVAVAKRDGSSVVVAIANQDGDEETEATRRLVQEIFETLRDDLQCCDVSLEKKTVRSVPRD
jgi:hypothetical protein